MKRLVALAAVAFVLSVPLARAGDDESEAIQACRTAISAQTGVEDSRHTVRLNRIQRRPAGYDVRFRVRRPDTGLLSRVDCAYDRDARQVLSVELGWRAGETALTDTR